MVERDSNSAVDAVKYPSVLFFVALESERDKIVRPALERLGLLGRKDIWIVVTGVGKVNAAVNTSMVLNLVRAIDAKKLSTVRCINIGVCGGNSVAAEMAKCAQINRVCNNDFDTSAVDGEVFKKQVLEISEKVEKPRMCLTQDHFCVDVKELPDCEEPYYVDMELFAVASACANVGVKLFAVKSVCDVIGSREQKDQYLGVDFDCACSNASELLSDYLSTFSDVLLK